jgi:hypothetical protein
MDKINYLSDLIVGLSSVEASKILQNEGYSLRIINKNGNNLIVTRDYKINRVNVRVDGNDITEIINLG